MIYILSYLRDWINLFYIQIIIMPTFLNNHVKIQQIESRLNKNDYLSSECLPNFLDAQVFKALKSSDKIPKREIYPNFYHWYILMRQFADRTLDMWIKNHEQDHLKDPIILEILQIIQQINSQNPIQTAENNHQNTPFKKKTTQNIENSPPGSAQKILISSCDLKPKSMMDLTKSCSIPQKVLHNELETVMDYIMDIKLNINKQRQLESIQQLFTIQKVQLDSVKIYTRNQDQSIGSDIRVSFATNSIICQELKNKILRCSDVKSIQCKKYKRNQSQSVQALR